MGADLEARAMDDINVTPMLDVAYVLLIIFIIMTTATVQGIQVNLPQASAKASLAKPKSYITTDSMACALSAKNHVLSMISIFATNAINSPAVSILSKSTSVKNK
jgi:biopolymer transport protein ExbD